jgi:hypothetical protein
LQPCGEFSIAFHATNGVSVSVIEDFIKDSTELVDGDTEDEVVAMDANEIDTSENADDIFGVCDSSRMFLEFKEMLRGDHSISDIGDCAMRVMEYAQLGKIEKGSVSSEGKFKSLHGRWFNAKKSTTLKGADEKIPCTGQFIQRNSLITLNAKRGKTVSVEYYRVLGIFSKHYNKWYLHWDEEKVPFVFGSKKFKVMARMVAKHNSRFKEVDLVAGGDWSPKNVFVLRYFSDILSLEEGELGIDSLC